MPQNTEETDRFEVFFDEDCPLCKKEIDMVRRMDSNHRLILTNIAAADFDPSSVGKPLDTLMREIHGRRSDGSWVVGVEVFREIYGRVGFAGLTSISRWPVVRNLLDLGYRCFAWPRYRLALRRMNKAAKLANASNENACDLNNSLGSCRQVKELASPPRPVSSASAD